MRKDDIGSVFTWNDKGLEEGAREDCGKNILGPNSAADGAGDDWICGGAENDVRERRDARRVVTEPFVFGGGRAGEEDSAPD